MARFQWFTITGVVTLLLGFGSLALGVTLVQPGCTDVGTGKARSPWIFIDVLDWDAIRFAVNSDCGFVFNPIPFVFGILIIITAILLIMRGYKEE